MTRLETMEDLAMVLAGICASGETDMCPFLEMDYCCPITRKAYCPFEMDDLRIDYNDWKNVLDDLER